MASADTGIADRIWLCMTDSNRTRVVSRALAKGFDMTVYMGTTMDNEAPVAFVVADDAHAARIAEARGNAAPGQISLLVTGGAGEPAPTSISITIPIPVRSPMPSRACAPGGTTGSPCPGTGISAAAR